MHGSICPCLRGKWGVLSLFYWRSLDKRMGGQSFLRFIIKLNQFKFNYISIP